MRCRTEGAWVICPEEPDSPIMLVRIMETWEAVDCDEDKDEDGDENDGDERGYLVDGCVPMAGSIQAFAEVGGQWYERYGGLFTGYESVERFVREVFRFDPVRGCWRVAEGVTDQTLWPVLLDDCLELENLWPQWCESLARILSVIPDDARGSTLRRVPEGLRERFADWCGTVAESGALERGPLLGTPSFRRVVRECARPKKEVPCRRGRRHLS